MEQFMARQQLSVVSPYIDNFNLYPKAKRVNVAPVLDIQAGYHHGPDPTDVYLGDAPKMIYHLMPRKVPIAYPVVGNVYRGDGSVPLYGNQVGNTDIPNHNKSYASEFKYVPVKSAFEKHLENYFGSQDIDSYNRHKHPQKETGEYSLNETTHDKLERLIRSL